jgi:hypothetical protein
MKHFAYAVLLLICCVTPSSAQMYTQYFDGADTALYKSVIIEIDNDTNNVWQIGPPQKSIFSAAGTVPNVIVTDTSNYYPTNNTSRFVAKVKLPAFNFGIFAMQWKQKLDFDPGTDGGIIEYSIDSGSTWANVFDDPYVYRFYGYDSVNVDTVMGGSYAFSGTDSAWKDIWLCFDLSWLQQFGANSIVYFRYSLVSDSINNNKEGWMIDNLLARVTLAHTIKNVQQSSYLIVYPNPATNRVYIQAEKKMSFHIIEDMALVDATGRVVEHWTSIPTKFWFDVSGYNAGNYALKVKTNFALETIPLVISKE